MFRMLDDRGLESLVERLHEQSKRQSEESAAYFTRRAQGAGSATMDDAEKKRFLSDKLVAL